MTQIILDAALRHKLRDLRETLELRDESGTVLARVTPVLDAALYEPVQPRLSAEELERRRHEPEFSTADVLKHLEQL